jgi:hypothetical protein
MNPDQNWVQISFILGILGENFCRTSKH